MFLVYLCTDGGSSSGLSFPCRVNYSRFCTERQRSLPSFPSIQGFPFRVFHSGFPFSQPFLVPGCSFGLRLCPPVYRPLSLGLSQVSCTWCPVSGFFQTLFTLHAIKSTEYMCHASNHLQSSALAQPRGSSDTHRGLASWQLRSYFIDVISRCTSRIGRAIRTGCALRVSGRGTLRWRGVR